MVLARKVWAMGNTSKVEQAIGRFETALHKLEKSLVVVHEKDAKLASASNKTAALEADHKKIIAELEQVRAKADELAEINRQAIKRVDHAMVRIQRVIG